MAFAGGQEGGPALVDVLTGAVQPSGRMTLSVPRNVGAVPYYYNHKMKSAGTPIARHFGSRYPFGHGLGYTTFEYTDLTLEDAAVDAATERSARSLRSATPAPARRRGAAALRPRPCGLEWCGQSKSSRRFVASNLRRTHRPESSCDIPTDMLSFTGMDYQRRVEPGQFELQVGASSADIRLRASSR